MFVCYEITSSKTNKKYIGVTSRDVNFRLSGHFRDARAGSSLVFHKAIRKYGKETFKISVLCECSSKEEAMSKEIEMISKHNTLNPNGYNMTTGGEGVVKLCSESIRIKSEKAKLLHSDPDFKKRHSDAVKKSRTPEVLEKISKAHKGKKMHPNAAKAILAAKKTPEYREIARQATKKTWATPGYKESWVKAKLDKHIKKASRFPMRSDGLIFSSTRSAANYMKKNGWPKAAPNNICLVCNGKYKHSCGYVWEWVDGDKARLIGGIID